MLHEQEKLLHASEREKRAVRNNPPYVQGTRMKGKAVVRPVVPQHHLGPVRHVFVPERPRARRLEHGLPALSGYFVLDHDRYAVSVPLYGTGRYRFPQGGEGHDPHGFSGEGFQIGGKFFPVQVGHGAPPAGPERAFFPSGYVWRKFYNVSRPFPNEGGMREYNGLVGKESTGRRQGNWKRLR